MALDVLRSLLGRPLRAAFPLSCPACGRPAEPVCDGCAASMVRAPAGRPPHGIDEWVSPFAYLGVARELVARGKYRGAHAALTWLAVAIAAEVEARLDVVSLEVVTWAPTTTARRRDRGFDHAELLARPLARMLGLPAAGLLRRLPGPPQTGRPGAIRRIGPRFVGARPSPELVLLVDDVATTGATLGAAALALRRSGATRVVGATAARTPLPSTAPRPARTLDDAGQIGRGADGRHRAW